jgi:hypothetical protein
MGGQQHQMPPQNQGITPRQALQIPHTSHKGIVRKGHQGHAGLGHNAEVMDGLHKGWFF